MQSSFSGTALTRFMHRIETAFDFILPKRAAHNLIIDPYIGYSRVDEAVIRGRVLAAGRARMNLERPSLVSNAKDMIRNFLSREVAGVTVRSGEYESKSDEEGYFKITLPIGDVDDSQAELVIDDTDYRCFAPVHKTDPSAVLGIISDIDDTVMETGAWQLHRNIWTTFTKSAIERRVHADTVRLIERLQDEVNPVFYVSSSPWNLHTYISSVFERNGVPSGPKFLRDLGIDETKFIKSSHGSHKGNAIDEILAANPKLDFVLIGDTGQHDATVYLEAFKRHGERIAAIYLRQAGTEDQDDLNASKKITDLGIPFFAGPSFDAPGPQVSTKAA